jgi:hypothetical protein
MSNVELRWKQLCCVERRFAVPPYLERAERKTLARWEHLDSPLYSVVGGGVMRDLPFNRTR